MSVEDFKKRLLEQLKLKSSFEIFIPLSLGISLPLEIIDVVTIARLVGEEPLVHYEEICDISEAKNAILATWIDMRFFGRNVTYILKFKSDEKLNLTLFEKPEVHDVTIYLKEVDKKNPCIPQKPKNGYIITIERILHWATIILFLIEHALKIIGKGA